MKNKYIISILIIFCCAFYIFDTTSFVYATNTVSNISSNVKNEIKTYSPHVVVMESSTGKLVYEKDGFSEAYPASTTKIMTAILTLEHCKLTDKATVSHNAVYSVPLGYTHANLVEGEELTINQLLHILLIPSANDAATVLAEHIGGSVDSFATMMNTKAEELGCKNTHFVNANGIHNENHYSTAYDLALIGREAMKNEDFRKIVMTTEYTLPATNKYPEANRFFKATNFLIVPDDSDSVDNYYYPYATGIKTGYTNPAGDCIVASAKKDDKEYIVVILGAEKLDNGLSARYTDCKNLFNYAFDNYKTYMLHSANSKLKEMEVSKAFIFNNKLDVVIQDDINLLIRKDTIVSDITPTIKITSELIAPIYKDTQIGTITYEVDGNTYTSDLLAGNDVPEGNFFNILLNIAVVLVILYLLFKILKFKKNFKRKRKNKVITHKANRYPYDF